MRFTLGRTVCFGRIPSIDYCIFELVSGNPPRLIAAGTQRTEAAPSTWVDQDLKRRTSLLTSAHSSVATRGDPQTPE